MTGWWDKANTGSAAAITSATVDQYLFNGLSINRNEGGAGSGWSYATRYWPTTGGDVYFYAYSPASTANVTKGLKNYKGTKIAYTVPDPSATEPQEDFLLANPGSYKTGTVNVTFAHTLSRVKFFAKTTDTGITTSIGGIEMLNINKSGEIDFAKIPTTGVFSYNDAAAATPTNQVIVWETQADKGDLKLDMGTADALLTGDYKSIGGETNALMVLPQKTTMGNPTDQTGFLIKVLYKAVDYGMGRWYAGGEDYYEVKYFAVKDIYRTGEPHTFEIGRQYNFYLSFDEVGDPIMFDPSVSDWDDTYNGIHVPQISDYRTVLSTELANAIKSTGAITSAEVLATTSLKLGDDTNELTTESFKGIEYFENLTLLGIGKTEAGSSLVLTNKKLETLTLHRGADSFSKIDVSTIPGPFSISAQPSSVINNSDRADNWVIVDNLIVWEGFDVKGSGDDLRLSLGGNTGTPGQEAYLKIENVVTASGKTPAVTKIWVGKGETTVGGYKTNYQYK